jgi:hypothetical protein
MQDKLARVITTVTLVAAHCFLEYHYEIRRF